MRTSLRLLSNLMVLFFLAAFSITTFAAVHASATPTVRVTKAVDNSSAQPFTGMPSPPTAEPMSRKATSSNPTFQQSYWGANHARLAEIKKRYDPDGLFFVSQRGRLRTMDT
jgi:hypothetical protein